VLGNAYYKFAKEFPEYMQAIINFETNQISENNEGREIIERFNKETEKFFVLLEKAVREGVDDNAISTETDVVGTAILL
jgi:Rad3-related DNA helicase